MPTYVILSKWTDQGIRAIKDSAKRLDADKKAAEAAGVKALGSYLTMGRYDQISIVEAPSDEVMETMILRVQSRGTSRNEILRAFPEAEYRDIIANI